MIRTALCLAIAFLVAAPGAAAEEAKPELYPLATCAVSGAPLKDGGVAKTIEGREVRFCCNGCPAKFEANTAAGFAKLDEAIIADQKDRYPVEACIVMEHDIDMAKAHWFVADNRAFATCCPSCAEKIVAEPASFVTVLNEAVIEKQGADYPLDTCIVEDGALGDSPVNTVVAGHLMKTCCAGCAGKISADPAMYVAKLNEAAKN